MTGADGGNIQGGGLQNRFRGLPAVQRQRKNVVEVANSSTHFVAIGHEDVGKRPALARASKCEAL